MKRLSVLTAVFIIAAAAFVAKSVWTGEMAVSGGQYLAGSITTVALVLYFLQKLIGWPRATAFFAIAALVGYAFEYVGVNEHIVFGQYHYTEYFPWHIAGIPLMIPISWFAAVLTSLCAAQLFLPRKAGPLAVILAGAAAAVAYDIPVEYWAKNVSQAWMWEGGGVLFGVPLANFIGWFIVAAIILALNKNAWRQLDRHSAAYRNMRLVLFTAYAFMMCHLLFGLVF